MGPNTHWRGEWLVALEKHIDFIEELEDVMSVAVDEGSDEQNILTEVLTDTEIDWAPRALIGPFSNI